MDAEFKNWIITGLSVTLAPILTFTIAIWRIKRLGITKDNMIIFNERAEFRKDARDRAAAQDKKIADLDDRVEQYRVLNNRLYGRVMYLEAVMRARGIEFTKDDMKVIEYDPSDTKAP